jgi:hypothetical protein
MTLRPLTPQRGRDVIRHATGKMPRQVKVLFASDLDGAQLLRAWSDDGFRVWVFEGDAETPKDEWSARLRPVCAERGCRNSLGEPPKTTPGDDGILHWVCDRHAPSAPPLEEGPRRKVVVADAEFDDAIALAREARPPARPGDGRRRGASDA